MLRGDKYSRCAWMLPRRRKRQQLLFVIKRSCCVFLFLHHAWKHLAVRRLERQHSSLYLATAATRLHQFTALERNTRTAREGVKDEQPVSKLSERKKN